MAENKGLFGGLFGCSPDEQSSLLFFFLLLVILFQGPLGGLFGTGDELLFFFLLLVIIFCYPILFGRRGIC
ncbi:hypothetical protein SAMN02745975_03926 [Geosporobacter subterraneus DSM 17957]|uniref:Uncharacterized protein n=1 Tax=Geosporobacter subterraneus DSM 17957 TaxID=1121919 RepID=A0A1M6QWI7_9FIRM|nr:hypothetical protein SAMN02745975_03926 [Geosporobacter subterraneus DSM 17957]